MEFSGSIERWKDQINAYDRLKSIGAVVPSIKDEIKAYERLKNVGAVVPSIKDEIKTYERLKNIGAIEQYFEDPRKASDHMRKQLTDRISANYRERELYQQSQRAALDQVAYLSTFRTSATLETLCSTLTHELKTLQSSNATFAKSVTETIEASLEVFKELQDAELKGVEARFNTKLDALPSKLTEPRFWRRIQQLAAIVGILSLALTYVQYLNARADSEKNAETAAKLLLLVQQLVEQTKQGPTRQFVVVRPTRLKMNPTNRSKTVAILEMNDEVDYLPAGSHKWIQVAYNDGSSEICGWVQKKHLRRLN